MIAPVKSRGVRIPLVRVEQRPGGPRVLEVTKGDNLGRLARWHGVTMAQLREANPQLFTAARRNGSLVFPGDQVIIPDVGKANRPASVQRQEPGDAFTPAKSASALAALNPNNIPQTLPPQVESPQGTSVQAVDQVEADYQARLTAVGDVISELEESWAQGKQQVLPQAAAAAIADFLAERPNDQDPLHQRLAASFEAYQQGPEAFLVFLDMVASA
jgi:hypothetical protein